jgi:hypothetical protein
LLKMFSENMWLPTADGRSSGTSNQLPVYSMNHLAGPAHKQRKIPSCEVSDPPTPRGRYQHQSYTGNGHLNYLPCRRSNRDATHTNHAWISWSYYTAMHMISFTAFCFLLHWLVVIQAMFLVS